MRLGLTLSLVISLLSGSGIPDETQMIQIEVFEKDTEECCRDAVYGIYEDETCETELLDEEGKQILLTTNEEGKAEMELPNGEWYLQLVKPSIGYFGTDEIFPLQKNMKLELEPIKITFTSEREVHTQLYAEDGKEVRINECESGKTYLVSEIDAPKYHMVKPQEIVIPERKEDLTITLEDQIFGILEIHTNLPNTTFLVYEDEKHTNIVKDINEKDAIVTTDEKGNGSLSLKEGIYHIGIQELPSTYAYTLQEKEVEVKQEETTQVEYVFEKTSLCVQVVDSITGKKLDAVVQCIHEDGREEIGNVFDCFRNETCTIQWLDPLSGYFPFQKEKVIIPSLQNEPLQFSLQAIPFQINAIAVDQEDGTPISMSYELLDENHQPILEPKAGSTILVKETEWESGYERSEEKKIVIPETSNEPIYYNLCFEHQPFVNVSLLARSSTTITLFQNPSCTEVAKDRYGNPVSIMIGNLGVASIEMYNGTYYAAITKPSYGDWLNPDVHTVVCKRTQNENLNVSFSSQQVSLHVTSIENGTPMSGVTYTIYEDGKALGSFVSTGEDLFVDGLHEGAVVEVVVEDVPGQYTYTKSKTLSLTQNDCSLSFSFEPYVVLNLNSNQKDKVSCSLYEDEACTQVAIDLTSNPCVWMLSKEPVSFMLKPQPYWLKTNNGKQFYNTVKEILVDSSKQTVTQTITLKPVSLWIDVIEQEPGATLELLDQNHQLIQTWVNDGQTKEIEGDQIQAGQAYIVKQKGAELEQKIQLPSHEPEEDIKVTLESIESTPKQETPSYVWLVVGALSILIVSLGGWYFLRNEKVFKKMKK